MYLGPGAYVNLREWKYIPISLSAMPAGTNGGALAALGDSTEVMCAGGGPGWAEGFCGGGQQPPWQCGCTVIGGEGGSGAADTWPWVTVLVPLGELMLNVRGLGGSRASGLELVPAWALW